MPRGSLHDQVLLQLSHFQRLLDPSMGVGKGALSAPGEGPGGWRLQVGMGVCKGQQGLGRKASFPGLRGNKMKDYR